VSLSIKNNGDILLENMNFLSQKSYKKEQERFDAVFASMHVDGTLVPLSRLLQRAAQQFPQKTALIFQDKTISYAELYYRASLLTAVLQKQGLKPRDRALLFVENSIDFYVCYFAIVQCGAVVAALNIFLHEKELAHIIADATPSMIVTTEAHAPIFNTLAPATAVVVSREIDWTALAPENFSMNIAHDLAAEEMTALLYTSGTTGFPKGVMLSAKNIMTNIAQAMSRFYENPDERIFCALPLFHSFAQNTCVWSAFFVGSTVIVVPKIERRYILEGLRHQPTIFLGVPALFGLLCLLKTAPLDTVRYFVCGGDALPNKIRASFALVYGRNICNGYGLTESSPFISIHFDDVVGPTSNVGRPFVGMECRLTDDQGNVVVSPQRGELCIKGDNIMLGYYNAPDATEKTVKDGWLLTGDVVTFDDLGSIIICGREKDMIAHKGIKIYPAEIENIIMSHPAVMLVGVVGQMDDQAGELPVAFVQPKAESDSSALEAQFRAICVDNLAPYKVPRRFIIMETMPVTTTGKVDKKALRKLLTEPPMTNEGGK
jgi:long-chain acyl-CoA synthetase